MPDQNFDALAERFAKRIYGSEKGDIRLAITRSQMLADFPQLAHGQPLRILDAGAGMGQIALWLAELGHQVHVAEPSAAMIDKARGLFASSGCTVTDFSESVMQHREPGCYFHQLALNDLPDGWEQGFDLVVFHAVMEWLERPFEGLANMLRFIKPGGAVSVMFYNRNSLVLRNVIRGNLRKVQSGSFRGDEGGLTPQNPLLPEEVREALVKRGVDVVATCGVRVFSDYMQKGLDISLEDKIAIEQAWCRQQPYAFIARYVMFNGVMKD